MNEQAAPRPWFQKPAVWAGAGVLAVTALGSGAWAFGAFETSCGGAALELRVAAQPEIVPALRDVAARFNVEKHRVGDRCVRAEITAVAPAEYVREPARRDADAWVPESSLWFGRARAAGDRTAPTGAPSLAASPVVLATPRPVEAEFRDAGVTASWKLLTGGEAEGLKLARRATDPGTGMAGTVTMIALAQVTEKESVPRDLARDLRDAAPKAGPLDGLTAAERYDRPLAVTTEQTVAAYNQTHRPNPIAALTPREGTLMLDHPFAVTARDRVRKDAAEAFQATLGSRSAIDTLQRFGFRTPEGELAPEYARRYGLPEDAPRALRLPTVKEIDRAVQSWRKA